MNIAGKHPGVANRTKEAVEAKPSSSKRNVVAGLSMRSSDKTQLLKRFVRAFIENDFARTRDGAMSYQSQRQK